VYLHPQDPSAIDGYTYAIFGTYVVKCGALPRYLTGGLETKVLSLWVYSDCIQSLRHRTWVETACLWCCDATALQHLSDICFYYFYCYACSCSFYR